MWGHGDDVMYIQERVVGPSFDGLAISFPSHVEKQEMDCVSYYVRTFVRVCSTQIVYHNVKCMHTLLVMTTEYSLAI